MTEIVHTSNLYFTTSSLYIGENCTKEIGPIGSGWQIVSNNNSNGKFIICGGRLDAWDYNVFEFFYKYKEFLPNTESSKFEQEFLFNKDEELDPSIVLDFFKYLKKYISLNFDSDKHYYIVYKQLYNDDNFKYFFVWERIKVGESTLKISTEHTTFDKAEVLYRDYSQKENHNNEYELISEFPKKSTEWHAIPENNMLIIGNEVLLFEKLRYIDFLNNRLDRVIKTCELAIESNSKIRRNSDWF